MFYFFSQNSLFQQSISTVLILLMVLSAGGWILFYPRPVQAMISTADVWQALNTAWEFVSDNAGRVLSAANKAYSSISAAYDQWMKSESILAQAARIAAQIALYQILNMITNAIIKWIQGEGEPKFVSDWAGFLKDAASKAGGLFIDKYLGMGYLCEPFDIDIKIALQPVPTFEERVRCSITDMVTNIEAFYNDFQQGGWKGWIELTKPQNNLYGAYLIAHEEKFEREAKSREAALKEAESSGGFLSVKECVKGHTELPTGETTGTCNTKESCKTLEQATTDPSFPLDFICEKEKVVTPGSVLSDLTNEIVKQDMKILQKQIGDLADSMGILGPYVIGILNALTNRVMKEGLAYVQTIGPTEESPKTPLPPGTEIPSIDDTPAGATIDEGEAVALLEQQQLLKENLQTQLLPQQQSNLLVMQDIEIIEEDILIKLKEILVAGCSMPSWASSPIENTITSGDTTTETIRIKATNVGNILIEKTTITDPISGTTTTYSVQDITPEISGQIIAMDDDKTETAEVWIPNTADAITATKGFIQAIAIYLKLYEATLQPPTPEEQAALDEKKALMQAAKDLTITNSQKAAKSSATDLTQLNTDTTNISITVTQTTFTLLQARGISPIVLKEGTLYYKQNSLQSKLTQAESWLSTCSFSF